ncbi:hypothetical protein [Bacillus alkalicellulosilyticus]|uniref:hypothetical protein n=1 Tax=Alkalihalobacterium alkalicellulosilyticum TaxID=1912214 RepID=UPI0009960D86|nr:hypothetical protein [Bacillus alkalicellulosilyticus]
MKKFLIGIATTAILLCLFLIYNHNQLPTEEDVFDITNNWSTQTEEVYLVKKIDEDWVTVFRSEHFIFVGQLEQNRLGYWKFKEEGGGSSLASTYYPPEQDVDLTWAASAIDEEMSQYFGQIINPNIQEIKVKTEKDTFNNALIIDTNGKRFFYKKSDAPMELPINIRGNSESEDVIYSTLIEE